METATHPQLPSTDEIRSRINQVEDYLNGMETFGLSATVLIGIGDEIVLHQGYGYQDYETGTTMKSSTALSIGSISKQITSVAILQLVDQGLVDLHTSISTYLEGVPADKTEITLHHLLTHTSGLAELHDGDDFDKTETEEFFSKLLAKELQSPIGTAYKYCNQGYSLAARIIEVITGMKYQSYLRQNIFEPLGMDMASWFGDPRYTTANSASYYRNGKRTGSVREFSGAWNAEESYWYILGNGGVCLPSAQLFKYCRAVFTGDLISEQSRQRMLTAEKNNYGYGWDIEHSPLGQLIQHNGGSTLGVSAVLKYYADLDLTLIIMANTMIDGNGFTFIIENPVKELLEGEKITTVPIIGDQQEIKTADYPVADLGHIWLKTMEFGPAILHISGQQLLNKIFQLDEQTSKEYDRMNEIADQFASYMYDREWEEAFGLMKRKTDYQSRVELLEEIRAYFEKEHGALKRITIGGTIPMIDYPAKTHLRFIGEDSNSGIDLVWDDIGEILGFIPVPKEFPLTLLAAFDGEVIHGYEPQYGINVKINISDTTAELLQ